MFWKHDESGLHGRAVEALLSYFVCIAFLVFFLLREAARNSHGFTIAGPCFDYCLCFIFLKSKINWMFESFFNIIYQKTRPCPQLHTTNPNPPFCLTLKKTIYSKKTVARKAFASGAKTSFCHRSLLYPKTSAPKAVILLRFHQYKMCEISD